MSCLYIQAIEARARAGVCVRVCAKYCVEIWH